MSATRKQIEAYEVIDHGIDHEQYFQGCGTSFSNYTDCFTGIGDDAHEALNDAIEQAAMSDYDVGNNELTDSNSVAYEGLGTESVSRLVASSKDHEDYDSHHYYVSIRVR